jgi:acyl carrier protein
MLDDIREALYKSVKESSVKGAGVAFDDDTEIISSGILDSLGIFSVIAEIESKLNIWLPPEDIVSENFNSINAMMAMLAKLAESGIISSKSE